MLILTSLAKIYCPNVLQKRELLEYRNLSGRFTLEYN